MYAFIHGEITHGHGISRDNFHLWYIDSRVYCDFRASTIGRVFRLKGFRGIHLVLHVRQCSREKQHQHKQKSKYLFHLRTSSIPIIPINDRAVDGING